MSYISGDCLIILKGIPYNSIDAVITDPPYEINFMSKTWDKTGISYNIDL
jgi:DNA modification methylase